MIAPLRHTLLLAALAVGSAATGCGGRAVSADPDAGSGTCGAAALLVAPIDGTQVTLSPGKCTFEAEQAGRTHRIACDRTTCGWWVDDQLQCTCTELDYASTCANGVPLCAAWAQYFDFSGS